MSTAKVKKLAASAEALTTALDTVKTSPSNRLDAELHNALADLEEKLRVFLDEAYFEEGVYEDETVAAAGGAS